MNVGRRYGAASGQSTSALVYFGGTDPVVNSATSEIWNGSTWTVSATGATGRQSAGGLGNTGTSSAALAFGGTPPVSAATELYLGAGAPVTRTITTS